jgi:hypothetical protein
LLANKWRRIRFCKREHVFPTDMVSMFFVVGGKIYGGYQGSLARWSGTRFDRLSAEERQEVQAAASAGAVNPQFSNVDGW